MFATVIVRVVRGIWSALLLRACLLKVFFVVVFSPQNLTISAPVVNPPGLVVKDGHEGEYGNIHLILISVSLNTILIFR